MKTLTMTVAGMHCEACVAKLNDALRALPGVANVSVEIGSAEVAFDDQQCGTKPLLDAVRSAGFQLSGFKTSAGDL